MWNMKIRHSQKCMAGKARHENAARPYRTGNARQENARQLCGMEKAAQVSTDSQKPARLTKTVILQFNRQVCDTV